MIAHLRHRLLPLCLFFLSACTAAHSRAGGGHTACACPLSSDRITGPDPYANIPRRMQAFVDDHEVAGIVSLVATKDQILHLSAVGTSDGTRLMQTRDIFWIASMSKPITAVAAAILVDEGKLCFDDPVQKYLPEFRNLTCAGQRLARPIQIRDLLTHTSGLADRYSQFQPHWSLAQFTGEIATQPLLFPPGTAFKYSSAAYDVVGRIVEVVSGMPFDRFLQQRLFDPLGMKDTTFWISPEDLPRYAHTYVLQSHTLEETPIDYMYQTAITDRQRAPLGGAGLFSTAGDIARFYQMLLSHGRTPDLPGHPGMNILQPATLAAMTQNQIGALVSGPGTAWGYGFCLIRDPSAFDGNVSLSAGSFGHVGVFGTNAWADPKRGVICILMLERSQMVYPDDSPMRIAFQDFAVRDFDGGQVKP